MFWTELYCQETFLTSFYDNTVIIRLFTFRQILNRRQLFQSQPSCLRAFASCFLSVPQHFAKDHIDNNSLIKNTFSICLVSKWLYIVSFTDNTSKNAFSRHHWYPGAAATAWGADVDSAACTHWCDKVLWSILCLSCAPASTQPLLYARSTHKRGIRQIKWPRDYHWLKKCFSESHERQTERRGASGMVIYACLKAWRPLKAPNYTTGQWLYMRNTVLVALPNQSH